MTKVQTLTVRQRDGIAEYERHMQVVHRGDLVLRLPRSISHAGALGRSVSFAQFIATWANACAEPRIRTTLAAGDHDQIERFASRVHGLAAAYHASRITANDGRTNLRRPLLEAAAPRIRAMSDRQFASVAKGPLTELIFLNRADRQFHSAAYHHEPTRSDLMDPQRHGKLIVSPREMNALILNVLRAQHLPRADLARITPLLDKRSHPLGTLLHETFRNTAEHAYLDLRGNIPPRGVRCILIAARTATLDELFPPLLVSAEHPHLDSYFAGLRARISRGRRRLVHILELSILDTGPGFNATIAPHLHSDAENASPVAQCFRDHVTSKRGPNSGLGLGRILFHLGSLGGFLRIRTSSAEAFFSPLSGASGSDPTPHVADGLAQVTGTVVTMAVPLEP